MTGGGPPTVRAPSPELGAHTGEVLGELGLTAADDRSAPRGRGDLSSPADRTRPKGPHDGTDPRPHGVETGTDLLLVEVDGALSPW